MSNGRTRKKPPFLKFHFAVLSRSHWLFNFWSIPPSRRQYGHGSHIRKRQFWNCGNDPRNFAYYSPSYVQLLSLLSLCVCLRWICVSIFLFSSFADKREGWWWSNRQWLTSYGLVTIATRHTHTSRCSTHCLAVWYIEKKSASENREIYKPNKLSVETTSRGLIG